MSVKVNIPAIDSKCIQRYNRHIKKKRRRTEIMEVVKQIEQAFSEYEAPAPDEDFAALLVNYQTPEMFLMQQQKEQETDQRKGRR